MKYDKNINVWLCMGAVSLLADIFFNTQVHVTWFCLGAAIFFIGVKDICQTIDKLNVPTEKKP